MSSPLIEEIPELVSMEEAEQALDYPLRVAIEQVESLLSMSVRLHSMGGIDRTSAQTLSQMSTGLESLDKHFTRHPITSYTMMPSQTNYKVTQEGLLTGIAGAIINAVKAFWKFCQDVFKNIVAYYRNNKTVIASAQKATHNVGVLAQANAASQNVLNTSGNTMLTDEIEREIQVVQEALYTQTAGKWNALVDLMFPDGDDIESAVPLLLFKLMTTGINDDGERFMGLVTQFNDTMDGIVKSGVIELDVLTSVLPLALTMEPNPISLELAKQNGYDTRVRKAEGVTDYLALQNFWMTYVKSRKAARIRGKGTFTEVFEAAKYTETVLSEGFVAAYGANTDSLLKISLAIDELSKNNTQQMNALDFSDRAAVEAITALMSQLRSYVSGMYAMESASQGIYRELTFLTNVISQYEQRRRVVYDRYIADPRVDSKLRTELFNLRNGMRKDLKR
jgi:hypothetical protein